MIGDAHSTGAVIYGFLSLTDKLSSGVAILLIQLWDPSCSTSNTEQVDPSVSPCPCQSAEAGPEYYRAVMFYVPGVAALLALLLLGAGAVLRVRRKYAARGGRRKRGEELTEPFLLEGEGEEEGLEG